MSEPTYAVFEFTHVKISIGGTVVILPLGAYLALPDEVLEDWSQLLTEPEAEVQMATLGRERS